jgi:hypothetical protein
MELGAHEKTGAEAEEDPEPGDEEIPMGAREIHDLMVSILMAHCLTRLAFGVLIDKTGLGIVYINT